MKKILIISGVFPPEPVTSANMNYDLAEALAFADNEGAIEFDLAWNYTKEHGLLSAADAAKDENKDYVGKSTIFKSHA